MSDFPSSIVNDVANRPWPLPDEPWVMTQSWHDLLFAHWPVAVDRLREMIPPGLELELYDRQAWLGVIPFRMTNVAPRGVPPLPWVSSFPEVNVRTYVRVNDRPGVYFFSLDAGNPLAVAAARALFHLPYYLADIDVVSENGWVRYRSRRPGAEFRARYGPVGPEYGAAPGSLAYFLTERYCLYTVDGRFRLRRLDIHHPPWALQRAEAEIDMNTIPAAAGIQLPSLAPTLHFARRQDVVVWPLESNERAPARRQADAGCGNAERHETRPDRRTTPADSGERRSP